MKILVCGPRDYPYSEWYIATCLLDIRSRISEVLAGDANGVDDTALQIARDWNIPCRKFEADWARYGKSAGPRRNRLMLDEKPDLVFAFPSTVDAEGVPGSRGTRDTVTEAVRRGIEVRVFLFPSDDYYRLPLQDAEPAACKYLRGENEPSLRPSTTFFAVNRRRDGSDSAC